MTAAKNKNRNQPEERTATDEGNRTAASRPKAKRAPQSEASMAKWLKWILSLGVIWHLFVVFISPFSVAPTSQTVFNLAQNKLVRLYSDPLYLNHGYHFFAPDPPINQLVRYQVIAEDGALVKEGEFPNKEQQWPRLLYHRHMMLADQAGLGLQAYDNSVQLSMRSYARQLLRTYEGTEARIDLVKHLILHPDQARDTYDANGNKVGERKDESGDDMFEQLLSVREFASDLEVPLVELPTEDNSLRDNSRAGGQFE